ncbi:hypothetical protein AYI68_g6957, partial [Smittium mucronatum]
MEEKIRFRESTKFA